MCMPYFVCDGFDRNQRRILLVTVVDNERTIIISCHE